MRFVKMHGLGNDFVILDHRETHQTLTKMQAIALADRRFGIGCDQVIELLPAKNPGADLWMQIYNPDGSLSGMCGNAARCVIGLLGKGTVIETSGGLYRGHLAPDGQAAIHMGLPKRGWQEIPLSHAVDTNHVPFPGFDLPEGVAVNVGNPHIVFFVPDVAAIDLAEIGPKIENHPLFPERVNVEFVQIMNRDHLNMRVWERGAGITQACGTGATASFIAARVKGLCDEKATVQMPGGVLVLSEDAGTKEITQTGEWITVFHGEWVLR